MKDELAKDATQSDAATTKGDGRVPNYAWVFLIVFLCFLAVLGLLIRNAESLSRFGLLQQVYYLTLVPMSCAAGICLFGILPSLATWNGKALGGKLRLSGSVVGAVLVVIGGYYFIPKATYFPLTVYVHGAAGANDLVLRGTGHVFLRLGPETKSELIGENGQAVFPSIPADLQGQEVPGWVESEDYEATNPTVKIATGSIDMIVKQKIKHFNLAGTVLDEHGRPLPDVHVGLPAYHLVDITNNDGRFEFQVIAQREQIVDLTAEKQGYETVRLSPTLGDSGMKFSLKGVGNAAR
jgi:hypothetical protein